MVNRTATAGWTTKQLGTDGELLERFVLEHDESAFRNLVERHGPVVQAACRRVLGDRHEADDAFQATFLVLARRAGEIARPEILSHWLCGVAYRIAYKVKAQAQRRRMVEMQAVPAPAAEPSLHASWRELQAVLDEELHGLPEKYRVPLILVYLEGKTHEEAAALLGCPVGSMSWRLGRGRELLRRRLSRRGLALSAALLLLALGTSQASASSALVSSTVNAALAGAHVPGGVPAPLPGLADAVATETASRGWRRLWPLLTVLALLPAAAGAWAYCGGASGPPEPQVQLSPVLLHLAPRAPSGSGDAKAPCPFADAPSR